MHRSTSPGLGERPGRTRIAARRRDPPSLAAIPAIAQDAAAGKPGPANRLARETSPYLLLHAHNPVDWYPWGPEAFAKAKAENKPIFLSVGYSSCYWCHVMERESFMDAEIARFLNEHFVCIKVDREERPDVDQVYMAALQAFSTGGWPMSMFLLPDGRPFYGETYLPPRDRQGVSGFLTVLSGIAKAWREERAEMEKAADGLTEIVRRKLGSPSNRPQAAAHARLRRRGPGPARRAVRPGVRRVRLQPPERAPAQVPRAREPRLPARSASPRRQEGRSQGEGRGARAPPAKPGSRSTIRSAWCCSRSTGWRGGGFATSSAAVITAMRPAGTGSSRTSRRCSTTTPSSPRPT